MRLIYTQYGRDVKGVTHEIINIHLKPDDARGYKNSLFCREGEITEVADQISFKMVCSLGPSSRWSRLRLAKEIWLIEDFVRMNLWDLRDDDGV
jgi:hypothetical protein